MQTALSSKEGLFFYNIKLEHVYLCTSLWITDDFVNNIVHKSSVYPHYG